MEAQPEVNEKKNYVFFFPKLEHDFWIRQKYYWAKRSSLIIFSQAVITIQLKKEIVSFKNIYFSEKSGFLQEFCLGNMNIT